MNDRIRSIVAVSAVVAGAVLGPLGVLGTGSAGAIASSVVIDSSVVVSDADGYQSNDGVTWNSQSGILSVGHSPEQRMCVPMPFGPCMDMVAVPQTFYRAAIEISMASLPVGAIVTSASLRLRAARPDLAGTVTMVGYAGDGSVTDADVIRTGTEVVFTISPSSPTTTIDVDVTSLISAASRTSGFIGFALRQDPLGTTWQSWDAPSNGVPPILTIDYTLPDPTTTTTLGSTTTTTLGSTSTIATDPTVTPAFTG